MIKCTNLHDSDIGGFSSTPLCQEKAIYFYKHQSGRAYYARCRECNYEANGHFIRISKKEHVEILNLELVKTVMES